MDRMVELGVFISVIAVIVLWLFIRFRRWLYRPMLRRMPPDWEKPDAAMSELLQSYGYEVIGAKLRQKLLIRVDQTKFESRYYIDYLARDQDGLYAVKLAKAKSPIAWTGSGIRDKLLPYVMLYDELSGLLYVDASQKTVKKITFDLE